MDHGVSKNRGAWDSKQIDALLQEHQELIDLAIHEDALSWQLNLEFLGTNGALLAAAFVARGAASYVMVVAIFAAVVNGLWFFPFERSKLHFSSRLCRAYEIEDQLESMGIIFRTLTSAERTIARGFVHDRIGKPDRPLHWWERIELSMALGENQVSLRAFAPLVCVILWTAYLMHLLHLL